MLYIFVPKKSINRWIKKTTVLFLPLIFNACLLNPIVHDLFWPDKANTSLKLYSRLLAGSAYLNSKGNQLIYNQSSYVFTKGALISTLTPINSDTLSNCTSTPSLPQGLTLNVTNCAISGTPTAVQNATSYKISANGTSGNLQGSLELTVRGLNSFRFISSSNRTGNTNINCATQDESSGIGPYSINIPYDEDVLISLSTNFRSPYANAFQNGILNPIQLRMYIDGSLQHTFFNGRDWGQDTSMNTAFIFPMSKGDHSIELKYCGTPPNNNPQVIGAYQTILTATSLASSAYFDKKASYVTPIGTINLPSSGSFTNILDGSTPMSVTYTSSSTSVLLWQSLSFGSGVGSLNIDESFRLSPMTTEDLLFNSDGYNPINKFSYTPLAANSTTTVSAQYQGGTTMSIPSSSKYDNSLNLIGFKTPTAGNFGKTSITSTVLAITTAYVTLMTLNISNSYDAKYLISFTANNAHGQAAGDTGCFYGLSINGAAPILETISDNDSGSSRRPASIITIETIPSGTIPIAIQFKRYSALTNCQVDNAVFTILPLE